MKTTTLTFILFSGLCYGQASAVASGGSVSNGNGTLNYSVGQIDFQPGTGPGGNLSAGNQQPFEIFENPVNGLTSLKINMSVFPNPLQETLTLALDAMVQEKLSYRIIDLQGKQVSGNAITQEKTLLDLAFLQTGSYILEIRNEEEIMKSFKLIKSK